MVKGQVVVKELPVEGEKFAVVGEGVTRVDALEKVTGKARYTADFREPGILFAKLVRSPHPHANVVSIDASAAQAYPGVKCVVLPEEAPLRRMGFYASRDRLLLPRDKRVRYVGEPVAIVVAISSEIAEEAVELVKVKWEVLPSVFDAELAMVKTCKAILHPDKKTYMAASVPSAVQPVPEIPNGATVFKIRKGDVETGFEEADVIVKNRYFVPHEAHGRMERYIADAWVEADGTLVVSRAKKGIWRDKDWLCELFDLPPSRVRVIESYIGGDFGGKGSVYLEGLAALAAMKTGKKVRLECSREDDFSDSCMSPAVIVYIKDGAKRDGTIVARETNIIIDGGAYVSGGGGQSALCVHNDILACYKIENWKSNSYVVYTNNPPTSTMRGVDAPRGNFAVESNLDCLAHELGMDPLEIRKKNVTSEGDTSAFGQVLRYIAPKQCIEKAAELIGWGKKDRGEGTWKIGKGIALSNHGTAPVWPSDVVVKVLPDGTMEVRHGTDEVGQGINTVVAQLVAEEFGITPNKVRVVFGDTFYVPWDYSSSASRCTWHTGNAAIAAARDAKRQLLMLAAKKMGVSQDELETQGGRVYIKSAPEKSIHFRDLFKYESAIGHGEIMGNGYYSYNRLPQDPETGNCPNYYPTHPYLAYGLEVAVNTETGEVRVLALSAGVDVGQPINIKMVEGQIEGGSVMGIGQGLFEEVILNHGVMLNPNYSTYRMPTAMEVPSINKVYIESVGMPDPAGPYGAKPLGEMTLSAFFGALANAVYDAVGVRITDLPITRERVFWALQQQDKGQIP